MEENDIKELEQLHAELAEKDAENQSLADELAYMMCENRGLMGQILRMQSDRECVD